MPVRLALFAIAVCLPISAVGAAAIYPIVEPSHATIERREGQRLLVLFAAEGESVLTFKPPQQVWDWSRTSKLIIPVENRSDEPLTLRIRVESGVDAATAKSLSGETAIAPRNARQLALWLAAPPPRVMGMTAGPALAVAGLEPVILPLTATKGSVDPAHVTSIRFGISRLTVPRRLVVGQLQVEPPSRTETSAYNGIVDSFGQYRPGSWPEKVNSVAMLRAKGAEEAAILAKDLMQKSPPRNLVPLTH